MRGFEGIRLALRGLHSYKARTFLTVLGLAIGVGATVAVLALGQSSRQEIETELSKLGTQRVWISAARGAGTSLGRDDVERIERGAKNALISPVGIRMDAVQGKGIGRAQILGCTATYREIVELTLLEGRFLREADEARAAKVVVLDEGLAKAALGSAKGAVGKSVTIGGRKLSVIGVVQSPTLPFYESEEIDGIGYMALSRYERTFAGAELDQICLSVAGNPQESGKKLASLLDAAHGVSDGFRAYTLMSEMNTANRVIRLVVTVLVCVAAICMLVGGLGVMNILLVSVRERRKEIGILMAIGAGYRDVLLQFVYEAMGYAILGGVFGVCVGLVLVRIGDRFLGLGTHVDGWVWAIGLAFSLGIGIAFGIYPAMRAARMQPVEALREG